jgi:hypothetical protein
LHTVVDIIHSTMTDYYALLNESAPDFDRDREFRVPFNAVDRTVSSTRYLDKRNFPASPSVPWN